MVKAANRTPKPKSTGWRSGHGLRNNVSHPHRASQLSPPHRQRAHPFLNIPRPVHLARRTTHPVSWRGGRRWCHLGKNTQQSARLPSRMTGRRGEQDSVRRSQTAYRPLMGALVAGVIGFSLLAVLFTAAVRSSARHRGEVTVRHLGSGWRADAGAVNRCRRCRLSNVT
jgi:hypothetical protein